MIRLKRGQAKAGTRVAKARPSSVTPPEEPATPIVEGGDEIEVEVLGPEPAPEDQDLPVIDVEGLADESDEAPDEPTLRRYDPLTAYLSEIRQYPPLSPEEEGKLARSYVEQKDLEAAYRLVRSNLWLVVKIAREYERAARNLLDLVQEGNIGLMEAVKHFDPYRGVRFPSYAVWWIRAYVIRYVIANWRLVKIGTTQAQRKLFFNLMKEKERLEREGFKPEPKLLAARLDVKESEITEMEQRLSSPDVSVDAPLTDGSEGNLLGLLPSGEATTEDVVAEGQLQALTQRALREFAATLSEKERAIFEERLLGDEQLRLQDLAERFSISRERVRQIENRIKDRLRDFLRERFGAIAEQFDSERGDK